MSRTTSNPDRKAKKSFRLSTESVAFLEAMQQQRRTESVSSVLEEILQGARREQERASIDRAVTDYYSSLTDTEVAEQAEWGEFALRQFTDEKRN